MVATAPQQNSHICISKCDLMSESDVPQMEQSIKDGKILFVNTKNFFDLYQDDLIYLKKVFDQLKQVCSRYGGSIGRIGDDLLVISPQRSIKLA